MGNKQKSPKMQINFAPATSEVAELIREAMGQGHAVMISLAGVTTLADRPQPLATTCSLLFRLTRTESLILAELLSHAHVSRDELHRAVSPDGKSKFGTVSVAVCSLRKKMRPHDVDIITDYMQGFRLTTEGRNKLRARVVEYDTDQPNAKHVAA